VRAALAYVLLNARRHMAKRLGRRRVPSPVRIDPASSGRWFDGWRRELPDADRVGMRGARDAPGAEDPPAVRRPRTWLLGVGWRRHGLLDPAEVPGGRG
jgi:hypothetical protein